jgi:hypothetical protein
MAAAEARARELGLNDIAGTVGGYIWPCNGIRWITSMFGGRQSPGGIGSTNTDDKDRLLDDRDFNTKLASMRSTAIIQRVARRRHCPLADDAGLQRLLQLRLQIFGLHGFGVLGAARQFVDDAFNLLGST